jgi:hypothetical protein
MDELKLNIIEQLKELLKTIYKGEGWYSVYDGVILSKICMRFTTLNKINDIVNIDIVTNPTNDMLEEGYIISVYYNLK